MSNKLYAANLAGDARQESLRVTDAQTPASLTSTKTEA
jgi:hypothetical protein